MIVVRDDEKKGVLRSERSKFSRSLLTLSLDAILNQVVQLDRMLALANEKEYTSSWNIRSARSFRSTKIRWCYFQTMLVCEGAFEAMFVQKFEMESIRTRDIVGHL